MLRTGVLLAALALACAAAERDVERAARTVRLQTARAPFGAALDSYLRTAQLLRATEPALAWECAAAAAELVKRQGREVYEAGRVARSLMDLDPARGEPLARSLPGSRTVLNALVGYWLAKGEPRRAAAIVREGWRGKTYLEAAAVLRSLAGQAPAEAVALFADFAAQFPEEATLDEANTLLRAVAEIAPHDAATAARGLERLVAAVSAEKFNARGFSEMSAQYKLGGAAVKTENARSSLLLAAGLYLYHLDRQAYDRSRHLFATWDREIAAVPKDEMAKAARPQSATYVSRQFAARGEAADRPPAFDDKLSFAEALAKVQTGAGPVKLMNLTLMLARRGATASEQQEVARLILPMLPEASFQTGRLRAAAQVFELAVEKDWKPLLRPSAAALETALADLARCREPSCDSVRNGPDLAKAYETLASGARRAGIKLRTPDAGLAARMAILDLKALLDRKFDFDLAAVDGRRQRLSAHRGNVVLLNFWASW